MSDFYINLATACDLVKRDNSARSKAIAVGLVRGGRLGADWWMFKHQSICDGATDEHHVFIFGDIGGLEGAGKFLEAMQPLKGRIILTLDCRGGDSASALKIGRFLAQRGNVLGIVTGECLSAANLILVGCSRRVARPAATFMVHAIRLACVETPPGLRQAANNLEGTIEGQAQFLSDRTGQTITVTRQWLTGPELHFTADEAHAAGLVDIVADGLTTAPALTRAEIPPPDDEALAYDLLQALRQLDVPDKSNIAKSISCWVGVADGAPDSTPAHLATV